MEINDKRAMILSGSLPKILITMALPLMFNNFVQMLYSLADTYWVGNYLGTSELAAIILVFPVLYFTLSLGMGVNIAGTALISRFSGAGSPAQATKVAGQLLTFALLMAVAISLMGTLAAPWVLRMMGAQGAVYVYALQYVQIMLWELPALFAFFVFNAIRQGQGDTYTPMVLNVSGVLLNIVLDPIAILFLGWGIRGVAAATVFSRTLFAVYAVYSLFRQGNGIRLRGKDLKMDSGILTQIVRIGLPASTGQSFSAFGFIILNAFVIGYGEGTLAAFGIGNRISMVIIMPVMGIGTALATLVGQNLGAGQPERARRAVRTAALGSITIMSLGGIILFLAADLVVGAFIKNDPEVLKQSLDYTRLITLTLPLMAIFQILLGTFQGSGHTLYAMMMDMGRLWVFRIPLILLLGRWTSLGSHGVWYAMVISNALICFMGWLMYRSGKWQQPVIRHN
ncbi:MULTISPECIES: MATE family efflux transporter [Anoxynatronum]|uniref:Efflux protein, MATE family n=2 Tax=Anoxynatronum TaxID=210622 RepID=A0AA45WYB2_9CLOT|nr:MATE family efflux transporter [Anoxynatronum buryatiense]SMP66646.1 putative efflux protein, MATE family [Anoxynatronum buryatiense]